MPSLSEENYLKAILFLSGQAQAAVSTSELATRLDAKAASVTEMLRRLSEKKWVEYRPYKDLAAKVLRKHRLWETFLVEKLHFGWEEVHEVAEQLEHISSPKLTDRLSAFLGHPEYDPHGDPIPDPNGVFPKRPKRTLSEVPAGQKVLVQGVRDGDSDFLRYVRQLGIALGDELEVEAVQPFDQSQQVRHGERLLTLSAIAAANIYVL
jgi:DtxR family Mn-dependent transcriptional regulator